MCGEDGERGKVIGDDGSSEGGSGSGGGGGGGGWVLNHCAEERVVASAVTIMISSRRCDGRTPSFSPLPPSTPSLPPLPPHTLLHSSYWSQKFTSPSPQPLPPSLVHGPRRDED